MKLAFLSDRPETGAPGRPALGDGPADGPMRWGFTRMTRNPNSPEGWSWSPDADPGHPGNIEISDAPGVLAACRAHLATGPDAGLLVHVHGAGCPASLAFERLAKLCTVYGGPDLRLMGLVVSWASGGFSIGDYLAARRRLIASPGVLAQAFSALLRGLHQPAAGQPVFLLAHSLGHHLLACVLRRLADADPAVLQPVFREVLLCAADVDADALLRDDKMRAIERIAQELHVYASPLDSLPGLSFLGGAFIPERDGPALGNMGSYPRAGSTPGGTPLDNIAWWPNNPPPGIAGEADPRHHYWHTQPNMVEDVRAVLRGMSPKAMPWRERNWIDKPVWQVR